MKRNGWATIRKADGHMIGIDEVRRGFVFQEDRANEFRLIPLPDPPPVEPVSKPARPRVKPKRRGSR